MQATSSFMGLNKSGLNAALANNTEESKRDTAQLLRPPSNQASGDDKKLDSVEVIT